MGRLEDHIRILAAETSRTLAVEEALSVVSQASTSMRRSDVPVGNLHHMVEVRLAVGHNRSRLVMTEDLAVDMGHTLAV